VTVTAAAQNALPPLALSFDREVVLAALAALVVTAALGAGAAARRAL
jgi:hypothetical protein